MSSGGPKQNPPASGGSAVEALEDALERICFLEWRLEQTEGALADARTRNAQLRAELSEASRARARAELEQANLTDRLAEAHRALQSLEEQIALAERGRTAAEAHGRELGHRLLDGTRLDRAEIERERQRAEVATRALADARTRLDTLERSQARFFVRLEEWQRLLGSDPDRIDLAEFIAELRGDVVSLSHDRERGLRRERRLRLALVEAGGHVPSDAEMEADDGASEAPAPAAPVEAAIRPSAEAAPVEPRDPAPEDLPESAAEPAAPERAPSTASSGPSVAPLRAALKAKLTRLDAGDAEAALTACPEAQRARARPLLAEIQTAAEDRALAAARALAGIAPEVAAVPVAARLQAGARTEPWLKVLGQCRGELALSAARRHLSDEAWTTRVAALEAVLSIAPDDRAALEAAFSDPEPRARRRAALLAHDALGRDALLPLLDDPSPEIRRLVSTLVAGHTLARAPAHRALARLRRPT